MVSSLLNFTNWLHSGSYCCAVDPPNTSAYGSNSDAPVSGLPELGEHSR